MTHPTSPFDRHSIANGPSSLPTGTVTFLFTDIEGSTKRWEQYPQQMQAALHLHDAIMRVAIEEQGGYVFKTMGDAFCAAFPTPLSAFNAAIAAQRALFAQDWEPEIGSMRVRMALHTGMVEEIGGDYFGQPVNRVTRLLSAGHGGQVLLSEPTYDLVRDTLPPRVSFHDLAEHRLKDLIRPEHIFQLVTPDLPSEFPPLRTLDNRPNNLPVQLTPLIGREKEIAEVASLLRKDGARLATLTGPGGTGKTRLALQVGAEMLEEFEEGVYFVELAALLEHKLVVSTVASTLGLMEGGGIPILETLKEYLKDKRLLLILDNFEQVGEAGMEVAQILSSCPHIKVLVTSRVPLRVRGEREYPVPPLSLPDYHPGHLPPLEYLTQYEAVRLFIERATDIKPDFQVTNDNAPAVAEICVRLDGLPLAIELAAARIRLFPPQALLVRLSSRLKILTGGARNLAARQQTLRGAIDWSYDLLDEGEKQLFRRMAVFQGGRTLGATEAVCNADGDLKVEVLDGVESLVEKNLLQQREGSDGEPRFWMLETIHEYAREKLQESEEGEALEKEHALYFMRLAEEAEPHLTGPRQQEWLDRLEDEYDNIRAALGWASEHAQVSAGGEEASEVELRTTGAIWRFWYVKGLFTEGRGHLGGALTTASLSSLSSQSNMAEASSRPPAPDALSTSSTSSISGASSSRSRAKALNGAGALARMQGDYSSANSMLEAALVLGREAGDKASIAFSLNSLGIVTMEQGDFSSARTLYEESLALRRELGDKWGIAKSLNNLGNVAQEQGDYSSARSMYEESLALCRELGDKWGIANSLSNLGLVAQEQGDYSSAHALHKESLALCRELGNKGGIAEALSNLGHVALHQGDYAAARSMYEESLALRKEIGDNPGIAASLAGLGWVVVGEGQVERGTRLVGAVEGLLQSMGAVLDSDDRMLYERRVQQARALLAEEAFDKAWQEGLAMGMEAAIAYALEETTRD